MLVRTPAKATRFVGFVGFAVGVEDLTSGYTNKCARIDPGAVVGVDCVPAGSLVLVGVHSTRGEAVGIVRTELARREGVVLTLDWVGGEDIDDRGLGWVGFVVVSLLAVMGELATAVGVDWAGGGGHR